MFRTILLTSFYLIPLLLQPVKAGDEDMLTPYAEFDPETGFFLPPDESLPVDSPQDSPPHVAVNTGETNKFEETAEESKANPLPIVAGLLIVSFMVVLGVGKFYQKGK